MTLWRLGKCLLTASLPKRPRKSAKMEAVHPRSKSATNVANKKDKEVPTNKKIQILAKTTLRHYGNISWQNLLISFIRHYKGKALSIHRMFGENTTNYPM